MVGVRKKLVLGLGILLIFSIYLAFASHNITIQSGGSFFSINEDTNSLFNITVNNTDAGQEANITRLNITIPSSFTFVAGSNGTNIAVYYFNNTSTILSWSNSTNYLINGSEEKYFWFNATATTPGNYSFTITTVNASNSYNSTISVEVNDTTIPYLVEFVSPTLSNNTNSPNNYLQINISAKDSYSSIETITINLYNSSGLVNSTNVSVTGSLNASGFVNFTNLENEIYYVNASVIDSAGNINSTQTRNFNISYNLTDYIGDIYFTIIKPVYQAGRIIELKGYVYQTNYSSNGTLIANHSILPGTSVNLSIIYKSNNSLVSNYTLTTDNNGMFYSRSNYFSNATLVSAPISGGDYYIKAEYTDFIGQTWYSIVEISVVDQSIDLLRVSTDKASYNAAETINVEVEAVKVIGDEIITIANISVNGTLRLRSTKASVSTFSCTTNENGKCLATLTAPTTYGNYIIELNNYKAYSSISVTPFKFNMYIKDGVGKSVKNVFARNDNLNGYDASVEVSVSNASSYDIYSFSGYIKDSNGSIIQTIPTISINSNNSFTNKFVFEIFQNYSYGVYTAEVTVSKSGDGSINSSASFEVSGLSLHVNKKSINSGFENGYNVFPNQTMRFEAYVNYNSNGSIYSGINESKFQVNLTDNLNNILSNTSSVVWNSSCGKDGCYEFSVNATQYPGEYSLKVYLSNVKDYDDNHKLEVLTIKVINLVVSAQSTDSNNNIKELFGTNEYVYLSLDAYNLTQSDINLTDAEVIHVVFMNGTEFTYINVSNFSAVNSSNSDYEWSWNSTLQMIKLDVPKIGGLYNVYVFGNNRSAGTNTKFIVNPYSVCSSSKNTPGSTSAGSGYYYIYQFKTTDTIYFELQVTQANNPLGRASVENLSGGSNETGGMGSQCNANTQTNQVVSNATVTIMEVKNSESGSLQNLNTSASVCQTSDNSGRYSCTVQPLTSWEGGGEIVKFKIVGQDGIESIAYGRFEARAFYLYGYTTSWQNNPSSNISLNIQLYEAGNSWWSSYGNSGGLSGTVSVEKIEYQGDSGEWLSVPVIYNYNVSQLNTSTITNGRGNITLSAGLAPSGSWKTGYYRAMLKGTTTSGSTDYGYAWFGVKLWDVYGQPIECDNDSCDYKYYFNSKDNITMYIRISPAGSYYYSSGESLGGNVTISVKKILDCRTWPCKELNSSRYTSDTITVNASNPSYWYGNGVNESSVENYLLHINTTQGTWNTGYYSVVLDVNGSDTGYSWFNTIAFYVSINPTDKNGSIYKYSIKNNEPMYFNVSTIKNYKGWSSSYNESDYINTTIVDAVLRTWNETSWESIEYDYPEDFNISPSGVNGNQVLNVTMNESINNGRWSSGYYWGELTLINIDNETSNGYLWFSAYPFRVDIFSNGNYEIGTSDCVNATINIYEPDWSYSTKLEQNFTITNVYENLWTGYYQTQLQYTNYTTNYSAGMSESNKNITNGTSTLVVCPNNRSWGSGSWGGYHSLSLIVQDSDGNTRNGWLSFRAMPFKIQWGSIVGNSYKRTNEAVIISANITSYSTGENATGKLTQVYQWRYENGRSERENYVFKIGNCWSNVSGECEVNGNQNVTIYPPASGWMIGYNYLNTLWSESGTNTIIENWNGIYFEGRETYNGYFNNIDLNGWYKYDFDVNDNITIMINVRDLDYNPVSTTITNVYYSTPDSTCYDEWCRTYNTATWSLAGGGSSTMANGSAMIIIQKPSSGWATKGISYIKASVNGGTIKGGSVRIKDSIGPNITIISPANNASYNLSNTSLSINFNTIENAICSINIYNYDYYYSSFCNNWNLSNMSSYSADFIRSCNITNYPNFNGSTFYYDYLSENYRSVYKINWSNGWWSSSSTGLSTGGTNHLYNYTDISGYNLTTNQSYGIYIWCYDSDYNYKQDGVAFNVL